jgi:hypothetical protein
VRPEASAAWVHARTVHHQLNPGIIGERALFLIVDRHFAEKEVAEDPGDHHPDHGQRRIENQLIEVDGLRRHHVSARLSRASR